MKQTVTESMFGDSFRAIRPDNFSHEALGALWGYYQQAEEDTGEEMELDVIAICCDWTEYDSIEEAAEAYGWEREEPADERSDINDRKALEFLTDETTVLELDNGHVIVLNY